MGSNPSKSQQLQSMFPEYKIIPELSINPTNCYQLIYVTKDKTNEIYVIKQSIKQPTNTSQIKKSNHIIQVIDCKKIQNIYYTLYQWIPNSLEKFMGGNQHLINKNFIAYLIHTLVKIYSQLWKYCQGNGLDITSQNIRAFHKPNFGLIVKVFPPHLTYCSFPPRKVLYRNRINDLGEVLYAIFRNNQKQIGQDITNFINKYMRGTNIVTNVQTWEQLEQHAKLLLAQPEVSQEQIKNQKMPLKVNAHPNQKHQGSVSIIVGPNDQYKNRQITPIIIQNRKERKSSSPLTPTNTNNISQPRTISPAKFAPSSPNGVPMISKFTFPTTLEHHHSSPIPQQQQQQQQQGMYYQNNTKPMLAHVRNFVVGTVQNVRENQRYISGGLSPHKYTSAPNIVISPNKYMNNTGKRVAFTLHQNKQVDSNKKSNEMEKNIHPFVEKLAHQQNISPTASHNTLSNVSSNPNLLYQTLVLTSNLLHQPQSATSSTPPSTSQIRSPSPIRQKNKQGQNDKNQQQHHHHHKNQNTHKKLHIFHHHNQHNHTHENRYHGGNSGGGITLQEKNYNNSNILPPEITMTNTKNSQIDNKKNTPLIKTPTPTQQHKQQIHPIINNPKTQKPLIQPKTNKPSQDTSPSTSPNPVTKIPKTISIPPLFEPSPRDSLQIRPKLGVPSMYYTSKTFEDKHELDEDKKYNNNKQSITFKIQSPNAGNFIQEHLMLKNQNHKKYQGKDEQPFFSTNNTNHNTNHNIMNNNSNSYVNSNTKITALPINSSATLINPNPNNKPNLPPQTKAKQPKQLLGSSIPFIAIDKSSSFGLTISEDSDAGHYDGIYQGVYHPTNPTVKHGVGKLVFPSGGSYQGHFAWNKMDGWGKLFYPSGHLAYEGYWKNSKFQGYGKLFNQNPLHIDLFDYTNFNKIQQPNSDDGYWKYYEGNMKNDMKEGHGVLILENGQKYDGEFHNDMVEGNGVFYGKKGKVEGVWESNLLVKVVKSQ